MKILFLLIPLLIFLTGCGNKDDGNNINYNRTSYTENVTETKDLNLIRPTDDVIDDSNSNAGNTTNHTEQNSKVVTTETQIATFTTTIYDKDDERQNNVRIACGELNGKTVAPGETFSFTETLGPAHPDDGYQKAKTFDEDGDIVQEYGGGKCQISSTLYNAVLAVPELKIIERHEHSNDVPYVEDGMDAAVAYGSVDLKFENNTGSTIRIDSSSTDDDITVSIYKI